MAFLDYLQLDLIYLLQLLMSITTSIPSSQIDDVRVTNKFGFLSRFAQASLCTLEPESPSIAKILSEGKTWIEFCFKREAKF
jgi:hypothetical protein